MGHFEGAPNRPNLEALVAFVNPLKGNLGSCYLIGTAPFDSLSSTFRIMRRPRTMFGQG